MAEQVVQNSWSGMNKKIIVYSLSLDETINLFSICIHVPDKTLNLFIYYFGYALFSL